MEIFGAGVVGLGMGRTHLQSLKSNNHVRLVALCDPDKKVLESLGKEFEVPNLYEDFDSFIKCKDLDLVSICAPDQFHAQYTVRSLVEGKHVLVEKPMARTIEECWQIIDSVRNTGKKVMVGQVCRFMNRFQMAKEMCEQSMLGELFYSESEYTHNCVPIYSPPAWRSDPNNRPIGPFGGGVHAVDLLRWICGEVSEVFAYGSHKAIKSYPLDDCIAALLKFENDATGKALATVGCQRPYAMPLTIYGTKGTLLAVNRVDPLSPTGASPPTELFLSSFPNLDNFLKIPIPQEDKPVSREIDCFVRFAAGEEIQKIHRVDAYEGAKTVAVCIAAMDSLKSKRPVNPTKFT